MVMVDTTPSVATAIPPRPRDRRRFAPRGTARRPHAPQRPGRRRLLGPATVAVLFLVGVAVLLYPSVASWVAQYNQSQQIGGYSALTEQIGPEGREQALADAHAYNAALTGGATTLGAFQRLPEAAGDASGLDYFAMLADDPVGVMARLKIPGIGVDLPIYHGTSDETLLRGVGHLQGTSLPVGGASTHSVLTAHRGLAEATMFNDLDQVDVGDELTIEVYGEVLTYQVIETQVIEPHETETLLPRLGEDLVTLVTCTPLGINSHRILVTAERVAPTPVEHVEAAGEYPDVPGFPWWAVVIVASVLAVAGYLWWSARSPGRRSRGRNIVSDVPEQSPWNESMKLSTIAT